MNNEIKEILNRCYPYLFGDEVDKLGNYITNLQQKVKHYEETQTFGDYVKEVNLLIDYKSRIEKAVEYIEHSKFIKEQVIMKSNYDMQDFQVKELLNILKGKE